ncbi:MAG: FtsW/RodA/SpoVE family cell cycle protein [Candidatus Calescibacterium sp.]|nr:FtsW/RodA/SpoVE family cell cycle protein [Candidatus Calescibacterium sp.]MCX7972830.1 FtsW/RodA/SpoVE family cell cycle protein [bacterium]MDW8195248.1 FtsW/RodA/SpoVE family cell cycle protein [Candidatus Calescibacterium sp.]
MINLIVFNLSVLLLLATGITFVGIANNFDSKFYKHLAHTLIGLVVFLSVSLGMIKITRLYKYSPWLWLLTVFILVLNLFIGTTVNGSKSWIYIGNFSFQPAELAKISLCFLFVWIISILQDRNIFFIFSIIITGFTILPIFIQPDLGFSVLLFFTTVMMGYMLGTNGILILIVLLSTFLVAIVVIKPYQLERLITFLDPYRDPLGSGWQTIQSVNCIINGGIWGQGLGNSMISKLGFLPEKDTDFIFSLIVEHVGLIGAIIIIALYIAIILSILWTYVNSDNIQNKILSSYIMSIMFIQVFINIGMNTMSAPVTGLPLPLISYGGTNIITTLFLLGIVNQLNIQIARSQKIKKWIE